MIMRHTSLLLTAALSLFATVANAQSLGEIRGRVLDPSGDPLPMAHVFTEVSGQPFGTTADIDGRFVLKPLPPGTYTVRFSYAGYGTVEVPGVEVVPDRASYMKDRRLKFSELGEIEVIHHRRPLIEIDDPSRMSLLAEDLKRDPNRRDPIALMSTNFPGVTRSLDGDGLHFRGSRTENMASFIDGVKVSGAVPRIPPSAISSVSVYTGGLPAKYGDVTGGVIVMETRTYFEVYEQERARLARLAAQEALEMEDD